MGTLFNQPERSYSRVKSADLESFCKDAAAIAKAAGISVAEVISAKHALELERQNELYVKNGDAHDEQMGGIGQLLDRIATALESKSGE